MTAPARWTRAFSTLGCPQLSLEQAAALAARAGIAALELRALSGTLDLPRLWQETFGNPASFNAAARALPARVVAFDTSLKLIGGTDADRQALLGFVPWAEALGVRWLRVMDGGQTLDDAEVAAAAEAFSWWRRERARQGWQVDWMIETHDSLLTAAAIERLRDAVGDFAVLWDSHHTWKKGGEPLAETWGRIRPLVVHVHAKDSISQPSARHPFTYVLPGDGEFPMAELRRLLARDDFAGVLSLEWEKQWHPYLPELDQALAAARARVWW